METTKKNYKKMYVPWFPLPEENADFIGYIHQGLHHEIGEEVEYPGSEWSYMHESESPFARQERSDADLLSNVLDEFYKTKNLDASRIHVLVHNGVVNLSGVVSSEKEKVAAEALVRNLPHVWNVENELEIEKESSRPSYFSRSAD